MKARQHILQCCLQKVVFHTSRKEADKGIC